MVSIATVLLSLQTVDGEADGGSSGHYTFSGALACVSLKGKRATQNPSCLLRDGGLAFNSPREKERGGIAGLAGG